MIHRNQNLRTLRMHLLQSLETGIGAHFGGSRPGFEIGCEENKTCVIDEGFEIDDGAIDPSVSS